MTKSPLAMGVAAGVLALALRLAGLGAILTVDEPQWIFRSQAFYRALEAGDPGGTFQGTHPGVVPMLLIGGGIRARELATGTRLESPTVGAFRTAAKVPVALSVSLGIGLAAVLATMLWGRATGGLAGVFLAVNPYFAGHSQLAHVDALLSILMLLSVLPLLLYVRRRDTRLLVCSGIIGGLAVLTKLPALLLFPLALFILVSRGRAPYSNEQAGDAALDGSAPPPAPDGSRGGVERPSGHGPHTFLSQESVGERGRESQRSDPRWGSQAAISRPASAQGGGAGELRQDPLVLVSFLIWSAAALLTFFLLWPSMWLQFLPNIRYFGRDVQAVSTSPAVSAAAEATGGGAELSLRALVARTPPVVLLLAGGGILIALARRSTTKGAWLPPRVSCEVIGELLPGCPVPPVVLGRTSGPARTAARIAAGGLTRNDAFVLLALTGGLFLLLTLVDKRADRYLLPGLLPLDLFAASALAPILTRGRFGGVLALVIVGGLGAQTLLLRPYALAYESPLAWREEPTQSGWGEGLEQAAALLNTHPIARDLTVATWYPTVFSAFFRGTTMALSSRDDHRVTHVVLYRNMRGRPADSPATVILGEFEGREPASTISVLGREVAWIYETDSVEMFPDHVGELVSPAFQGPGTVIEAGQFIEPVEDVLSGVRLVFSTFSSRRNTADLLFHLREHPDGPDLRTIRISATALEDRAWYHIQFEPLRGVRGKQLYLAVTSPNGRPGDAVTVQFQPRDILQGAMVLLRAPLAPGATRADHRREGDLGYTLLYGER